MSFFSRLRKKRKIKNVGNKSITSRLSFGSSDIQATYYARFLTPQIARISFFFVFLPPLRSSIMSLFISPTIVLPPRCSIRRLVLSMPLRSFNCRKENFNWSKKSPSHSLFFLYSRLYLESQFLVEGCYTFTRATKEISAK